MPMCNRILGVGAAALLTLAAWGGSSDDTSTDAGPDSIAADADDLLQESLTRALRFRHSFRPGTNLRAWLRTILRNTAVNQLAIDQPRYSGFQTALGRGR